VSHAAFLFLILSLPSDPAAIEIRRDLVYRTVDGRDLKLDAVIPPGEGPHPAILTIHGGAWRMGSKAMDAPIAAQFAKEGFAVFSIDYRLAPIHPHPAQIEDCVAAIQFVRSKSKEFRIDKDRFGAWGASAGAHLAALLATRDDLRDEKASDPARRESTRLSCVVAYFGPMLLAKVPGAAGSQKLVDDLMGKDATAEDYREASPVSHVSPDDPPFLLVHGTRDSLVPIRQSENFLEKLRAKGVACDLVRVEGGGHGDFAIRDPDGEHMKRTVAFLRERLIVGR